MSNPEDEVMDALAQLTIDAHGGIDAFRRFSHLTARIKQFGVLWALKGQTETLADANVKIDLKREWASHWPFAPTNDHSEFTPSEVSIRRPDGTVVETLPKPRESFAGFEMETPWSLPQLAYFGGYTMWTYLSTPFLLERDGVTSEEIEPWTEAGEEWRRLRVCFPESIATHSKIQTLYIGPDGLLRRHDYDVDIQGSNAAARYPLTPIEVSGITLFKGFRVFPRGVDNNPLPEPLIVGVDFEDYQFS